MKTSHGQRVSQKEVDEAIKDLESYPTVFIENQKNLLEENLKSLSGPDTQIVALKEHRKIKKSYQLITEVLRARSGLVRPQESISKPKPRTAPKRPITLLKIV